jgi:hypothetical protein
VEQKGKNTKGCLRKEESRGIFWGVSKEHSGEPGEYIVEARAK